MVLTTMIFNPETDPYITKNYNATTFRKEKVKNKIQLQKDLGLEAESEGNDDWYRFTSDRPEGL